MINELELSVVVLISNLDTIFNFSLWIESKVPFLTCSQFQSSIININFFVNAGKTNLIAS